MKVCLRVVQLRALKVVSFRRTMCVEICLFSAANVCLSSPVSFSHIDSITISFCISPHTCIVSGEFCKQERLLGLGSFWFFT